MVAADLSVDPRTQRLTRIVLPGLTLSSPPSGCGLFVWRIPGGIHLGAIDGVDVLGRIKTTEGETWTVDILSLGRLFTLLWRVQWAPRGRDHLLTLYRTEMLTAADFNRRPQ